MVRLICLISYIPDNLQQTSAFKFKLPGATVCHYNDERSLTGQNVKRNVSSAFLKSTKYCYYSGVAILYRMVSDDISKMSRPSDDMTLPGVDITHSPVTAMASASASKAEKVSFTLSRLLFLH